MLFLPLYLYCFILPSGKEFPCDWLFIVSQREEHGTPKGEFRRYFMLACCFPCVNTTGPPTFGAHPWCSQPQQELRMKARHAPRGDPSGNTSKGTTEGPEQITSKALSKSQTSCPIASNQRHLLHRQLMKPERG